MTVEVSLPSTSLALRPVLTAGGTAGAAGSGLGTAAQRVAGAVACGAAGDGVESKSPSMTTGGRCQVTGI